MDIKTPWGEKGPLAPETEAIWNVLNDGVDFVLQQENVDMHGLPPDPLTQTDSLTQTIAYRREPKKENGGRRDHYQPWWEVVEQKHGDCEDLSMFRVAYLRHSGEDPSARVALIDWGRNPRTGAPSPFGGGWHAVVARKDGNRRLKKHVYIGPDLGYGAKGWYIEDPSYLLGMRDPQRKEEYYSGLADIRQREPTRNLKYDPYLPFELGFIPPIQYSSVLSPFGHGRDAGKHGGVDLKAPVGTPIYAPESGVVAVLPHNKRAGVAVILKSEAHEHLFAHLSKIKAKSGQNVQEGDLIGFSGQTGNATTPHLHWQVKDNGKKIDPMILLQTDTELLAMNHKIDDENNETEGQTMETAAFFDFLKKKKPVVTQTAVTTTVPTLDTDDSEQGPLQKITRATKAQHVEYAGVLALGLVGILAYMKSKR